MLARASAVSETADELRGVLEVTPDMDVAEPEALPPLEEQLGTLLERADEHRRRCRDCLQGHPPRGRRPVQDFTSVAAGADDATKEQAQLKLDVGRVTPGGPGPLL